MNDQMKHQIREAVKSHDINHAVFEALTTSNIPPASVSLEGWKELLAEAQRAAHELAKRRQGELGVA